MACALVIVLSDDDAIHADHIQFANAVQFCSPSWFQMAPLLEGRYK
jgi:hypothetical protein